ncbi:unnamed protein product, partial [Cylicostephanus goldi]
DGFVSYKEGVDYAENVLKVHADENWERLFREKDFDSDGRLSKKDHQRTLIIIFNVIHSQPKNLDCTFSDPNKFKSLMTSWYRGDYNLQYNDYAVTSPDPLETKEDPSDKKL